MAETENKPITARQNMLDRARARYPERTFADLDATEAQEGVADLDEAINEMIEEYATNQKTYDEKNSRLAELLASDPSAAEFMQKWVEGGDPRTAIVEIFGDDLGMSEEGRGRFKDQLADWSRRKADNDALEAQAESNWQESLNALEEWGNSKGLSLEDKRDVMLHLLSIVFNGMENKYSAEDFEAVYHAMHYGDDVANARQEGEVAGRNAKIAAARRDRTVVGAMPPAPTGRQGGSPAEPRPKKRSFWNEVNNE